MKSQCASREHLIRPWLLILLTFAWLATQSVWAANVAAQKLFADGYELLKAGEAKQASAKFESGLKLDPKNALAYFYLGEAYNVQNERDKARKAYQQSLAIDPNSRVAADARQRVADLLGRSIGATPNVLLSPSGSAMQATLVVRSDAPCSLSIDGKQVATMQASEAQTLVVQSGQQLLECTSTEESSVKYSAIQSANAGSKTVVDIALADKVVSLRRGKEAASQRAETEQKRQAALARKRFKLPPGIPSEVEDVLALSPLFTSLPDSTKVDCRGTRNMHCLFCGTSDTHDLYSAGPAGVFTHVNYFDDGKVMSVDTQTLGGLLTLKSESAGGYNYVQVSITSAEGALFPLQTGNKLRVVGAQQGTGRAPDAFTFQCEVFERVDLNALQPHLGAGEGYRVTCGSVSYLCSNTLGLCPFVWSGSSAVPNFSGEYGDSTSDWTYTRSCSR